MKLLDLFCGAGGASMGYYNAGFDVTGIDILPQPRYPRQLEFIRGNAVDYLANSRHREFVQSFDVIHASPPCQPFSQMSLSRPNLNSTGGYVDLIGVVRQLLLSTGRPYVIENVLRSPVRQDLVLCGCMVGLQLYRERAFEFDDVTAKRVEKMHHVYGEDSPHRKKGSIAGHWVPGTIISVSGHFAPMSEAKKAMGITWMIRNELSEAIPPKYTEVVGKIFKTE